MIMRGDDGKGVVLLVGPGGPLMPRSGGRVLSF